MNWRIIASDCDMSSFRCQVIIWTDVSSLSIRWTPRNKLQWNLNQKEISLSFTKHITNMNYLCWHWNLTIPTGDCRCMFPLQRFLYCIRNIQYQCEFEQDCGIFISCLVFTGWPRLVPCSAKWWQGRYDSWQLCQGAWTKQWKGRQCSKNSAQGRGQNGGRPRSGRNSNGQTNQARRGGGTDWHAGMIQTIQTKCFKKCCWRIWSSILALGINPQI